MARTEAFPETEVATPLLGPLGDTGSLVRNLLTIRVMWQREIIRLSRSRTAILVSLITPMLFLFVLGTGMNSMMETAGNGLDFRAYLLPGILVMVVQAPAINTGISIMWDRQAGFLREMLVAPVRRSALITGICLGGATAATVYGVLVLGVACLLGIDCNAASLVLVLLELLVTALALTALGAVAAVSITRIETFQAVVGIAMMPLTFLSGALYPVSGLPGWLNWAVLVNPLTYVVDAIRRTLISGDGIIFESGPQWWGWRPPVALEVALVALLALLTLIAAARRFSRTE